MASVLDHKHFRDTQQNLTILHDEWMHNSTGTSTAAIDHSNGLFEHDTNPQSVPIPPPPAGTSTAFLGFSPSDMGHFLAHPLTNGSSGGNGSGGSNGGCPSGSCSMGGGICATGCPCAGDAQAVEDCYAGVSGDSSGGGGGKGGGKLKKGGGSKNKSRGRGGKGGRAEGARSLGNIPRLGNVPYTTQPTGGTSPILVVLVIGGGALAIYFIWHKLRKSKAEDKEMDKKGE
jgi:hypothetical protein